MAEFDLSQLDVRDAYRLLGYVVYPRPIALVTTVDREGRVNAAPFGYFNAIAYDPCMVVLGLEARPDGSHKDTGQNIRDSGEFVVHLVDESLAERMNICAVDFPTGVDEVSVAGMSVTPSIHVRPPRIAECPVALECRRSVTIELGRLRQIVVGEVLHIRVRDDVIDPATLRVDTDRLGLIGRAGGAQYVRTGDRFEMPKISHADWLAGITTTKAALAQK